MDATPDSSISGVIKQISYSPQVGNSNTAYGVAFSFENKNNAYRLGMTGDIQFVKNQKNNVLYLPAKFIKNDGTKKYVYLKPQVKSVIETGIEADEGTEIVSGLKEGDVVYDQTK